jgi:hypothetical protein
VASVPKKFTQPLARPLLWPAFILILVAYVYAFPYFDRLRSANEMPRLLQTQEFVDKGHFWLDERKADMVSQFDTSIGPDGKQYPNKAPGPSFLAIPVYVAAKAAGIKSIMGFAWAFRVFAVTLPALLFLPFFYGLTGRFTEDEDARRAALFAYALGSPAFVYGVLFMSHQLAAVCAGAAFVAAVPLIREESNRPRWNATAVGFFAAASVMMDYQSALAALIVGLYMVAFGPQRVRNVGFAAAGAAPIVLILSAYHTICFGSPLRTGYHYSIDQVTRKGFMGTVGPSAQSFFSTTFMPSNGLFVLAPWFLFAFIGAISIFSNKEQRARAGKEALVCLTVFGVYLLFLSSLDPYMARGGWCVGPRYLTVALPFAAWLACAGFAVAFKHVWLRLVALASIVVGVTIYSSAVTTYPHWPERLLNPLYELAFRLLRSDRSVHSLGQHMGLTGAKAAMPLFALVALVMAWLFSSRSQGGWKTAASAFALGGAVIAAYSFFPGSGPYAEQAWNFVVSTWEP